jgi:hypothetical protein
MAQYMMKAQMAIEGKNLLRRTPMMDPMKRMGIEMKAYWYWIIG